MPKINVPETVAQHIKTEIIVHSASSCACRFAFPNPITLTLTLTHVRGFQCGPAHGHGGGHGEGDDVVLFVGSGTTGAVAKLVSALHLDRKKSQSRFTRSKNDRLVRRWACV